LISGALKGGIWKINNESNHKSIVLETERMRKRGKERK